MNTNIIRIVQITDPHLFATDNHCLMGVNTRTSFLKVLAAANQHIENADVLLFTGDLSQDKTVEAYSWLNNHLQTLQRSYYWLAGNHDDLDNMRIALQSHPDVLTNKVISLGSWQIIMLNSAIPGKVPGYLEASELTLLEQQLAAEPYRYSLICLHHPAIDTGSQWLDKLQLINAAEFLKILQKYPNARCILCGHIHQILRKSIHHQLFLATPSTCVQFKPHSEQFALDKKAPGFRWLELYPDGTLKTGVKRIKLTASLQADSSKKGY